MKIFSTFPTVNISKLNFWLLICIAKNFIWTTLKMIFSIFRFLCTLRFQIYKYCPIITNHTSMEILFIQLSDDVYISILKNCPLWLVLCSWFTYDTVNIINIITLSLYYYLYNFCTMIKWNVLNILEHLKKIWLLEITFNNNAS